MLELESDSEGEGEQRGKKKAKRKRRKSGGGGGVCRGVGVDGLPSPFVGGEEDDGIESVPINLKHADSDDGPSVNSRVGTGKGARERGGVVGKAGKEWERETLVIESSDVE